MHSIDLIGSWLKQPQEWIHIGWIVTRSTEWWIFCLRSLQSLWKWRSAAADGYDPPKHWNAFKQHNEICDTINKHFIHPCLFWTLSEFTLCLISLCCTETNNFNWNKHSFTWRQCWWFYIFIPKLFLISAKIFLTVNVRLRRGQNSRDLKRPTVVKGPHYQYHCYYCTRFGWFHVFSSVSSRSVKIVSQEFSQ